MTFKEIYDEIIGELNELESGERFTTTIIQNQINQSQKALFHILYLNPEKRGDLGILLKSTTSTTTPIALPSDFYQFEAVYRKSSWDLDTSGDGKKCEQISPALKDSPYYSKLIDDANPKFYREGSNIHILPNAGSGVTIYYYTKPTEYTYGTNDSSSPDFPEYLHPFIKFYSLFLISSLPDSGIEDYGNIYFEKAKMVVSPLPEQKGEGE